MIASLIAFWTWAIKLKLLKVRNEPHIATAYIQQYRLVWLHLHRRFIFYKKNHNSSPPQTFRPTWAEQKRHCLRMFWRAPLSTNARQITGEMRPSDSEISVILQARTVVRLENVSFGATTSWVLTRYSLVTWKWTLIQLLFVYIFQFVLEVISNNTTL